MIIIKTQEQINKIRETCQLAKNALNFAKTLVEPQISTNEINRLTEDFILSQNGTSATLGYKGFPKSICTSINDEICHSIPSDRILQEGDTISIDVTVVLDGYFGDTCATFPVGKVKNKDTRLMTITEKAMQIGIHEVRPGNQFGNIGYKISKYVRSKHCSVVKEFCGHGVGLEFHEEPAVLHYGSKNQGPLMQPGMVFTIEPMVNEGAADLTISAEDGWTARTKDGKRSAQFEHTVLCTNIGVEILTA